MGLYTDDASPEWLAGYSYLDSSGGAGGNSINWGGAGSTLVDLAKVWGTVEVSSNRQVTPTYQVGPDGRVYSEGRLVGGGTVSSGGISPLLLLLLAGVAVFALKD